MASAAHAPDPGAAVHDVLAPGTPVTMSPSGSPSVHCLAEMLAWSTSPSGLVVTARAVTDPSSARQLDNRTVFLTGRTPDDALIVLEAVARHNAGAAGVLELVSVAALAREHRRAAVRAAIMLPVMIVEAPGRPPAASPGEDRDELPGTTIDLSGDGCRLRLDGGGGLRVGADVVTSIDLGTPGPVRVTGVVVDSRAGDSEVIISFNPMRSEDAAAIDATVFAALRG